MSLSITKRFSLSRFSQGERAQGSSIGLNHRRVFILPNQAGLTLGVVILLMLVASINYSNSMGFVFTFLLASAAQTSTFFSFRNLSGLQVIDVKNAPCFLGQSASARFIIKETEGRARWALFARIDACIVYIPRLLPNESYPLTVSVKPDHRGLYSPNTLTLSTSFPFGIFKAWAPLLFEQKTLVYPTPLSFGQALPMSHVVDNDGAITSIEQGAEDFAGFKPYQRGDHYRHINWKAWAAEKGLFTHQFSSQHCPEAWLDWSACSASDTEAKLSELCQWVLDAERSRVDYGLRLPDSVVAPSQGFNHQQHCLSLLALFQAPPHA